MLKTRYYCGLDLGQASDFTALSVIERIDQEVFQAEADNRTALDILYPDPSKPLPGLKSLKKDRKYHVRYLERFPNGTKYPTIVEKVVRMFDKPPLKGQQLIVDATGVGRPVVDMFTRVRHEFKEWIVGDQSFPTRLDAETKVDVKNLGKEVTVKDHGRIKGSVRPVTITGGAGKGRVDGAGFYVPKKELVSVMQMLLSQGKLGVSRTKDNDRTRHTFFKEAETFKAKINIETGNETWESWRSQDHDDLILSVAIALWVAESGKEFYMR